MRAPEVPSIRPRMLGLEPAAVIRGFRAAAAPPEGAASSSPDSRLTSPEQGPGAPLVSLVTGWGLVEAPPPAPGPQAGTPAHVERIDTTWLISDGWGHPLSPRSLAIGALPPAAARALCRTLGIRPRPTATPPSPLAHAAARSAWGHLVDMPPEETEIPRPPAPPLPPDWVAARLPRLPAARLHATIMALGAPPLGALLAHVDRRSAAILCARLSESLRSAVWAARQRPAADADASPHVRAALASLRSAAPPADPGTLLFSLGAERVGAYLEAHLPAARAQCAQLLPRPAGSLLLGRGASGCPTADSLWAALMSSLDW